MHVTWKGSRGALTRSSEALYPPRIERLRHRAPRFLVRARPIQPILLLVIMVIAISISSLPSRIEAGEQDSRPSRSHDGPVLEKRCDALGRAGQERCRAG